MPFDVVLSFSPSPSFLLFSRLSFSHFQTFSPPFSPAPPRDPSLHLSPRPTLLFPISTQGLMNAWPPIDRDG